MTNKKAIRILKYRKRCILCVADCNCDECDNAFDMAIKALEQKPKTGHWIKKDYWKALPFDRSPLDWDNYDEKTHSEKVSHWYCSECDADKGENRPIARFCEDCGAKMIEPAELKYADNETMMPAT